MLPSGFRTHCQSPSIGRNAVAWHCALRRSANASEARFSLAISRRKKIRSAEEPTSLRETNERDSAGLSGAATILDAGWGKSTGDWVFWP